MVSVLAVVSFGFLLSGSALGAMNMEDGMWEITMKMEMPGMPTEMPPVTFSQCLTKKDSIPQKKDRNEDCKIVSSSVDGNTVTWVAQCRIKDGTVDSTGKITYKGNGFDGVIKAVMNTKNTGTMEINQRMTGKRTGPCK
jgi:hypothetical protein